MDRSLRKGGGVHRLEHGRLGYMFRDVIPGLWISYSIPAVVGRDHACGSGWATERHLLKYRLGSMSEVVRPAAQVKHQSVELYGEGSERGVKQGWQRHRACGERPV